MAEMLHKPILPLTRGRTLPQSCSITSSWALFMTKCRELRIWLKQEPTVSRYVRTAWASDGEVKRGFARLKAVFGSKVRAWRSNTCGGKALAMLQAIRDTYSTHI